METLCRPCFLPGTVILSEARTLGRKAAKSFHMPYLGSRCSGYCDAIVGNSSASLDSTLRSRHFCNEADKRPAHNDDGDSQEVSSSAEKLRSLLSLRRV